MDSGYYVAYAGLAARMQALDVVATNLANASSNGFKAQITFYRALSSAQDGETLSPLNQAVNEFGILGGTKIDQESGSLNPTGNNLDLAMEGPGYFTVQTPTGIRYTRDGSFRTNAARQVVTTEGYPVLAEQGTTTVPIVLPTGEPSISPDGTISMAGGLVAKLHVVEFVPGTQMTAEGNSNYAAPTGSETAPLSTNVRQGMLESSNINPVQGAVGLILLQRQADLLGRALTILSTDFDRSAAQDLPRV